MFCRRVPYLADGHAQGMEWEGISVLLQRDGLTVVVSFDYSSSRRE
jgi:hypothetical protein